MKCRYCGLHDAPSDTECCPDCAPHAREAFALLLAGLAELFRARREREAAEKEQVA